MASGSRLRDGILVGALVLSFTAIGLMEARSFLFKPYVYDTRDDYAGYHRMAVDVVSHGLSMPSAHVPYDFPAGFFYVYFVALCYAIVGVHPPIVFVIQSALLAVTVSLLFFAFRPGLGPVARAMLLATLAGFALVDFQRYYAMQLYSENLMLLEIALFLWFVRRGFVDGHRLSRVLALAVLGAMPMTRPNAVLFVPMALAWLGVRARGPRVWRDISWGSVLLVVVCGTMAVRNHAAGGEWVAFTPMQWRALSVPGYGYRLEGAEEVLGPVARREGTLPVIRLAVTALWRDPLHVSAEYVRKMLFIGGFVFLVDPAFHYRPHWTILWVVLLAGLAWRLKRGPRLGLLIEVSLAWLVCYLGPLVAMSAISNYGYRYVVPAILPAAAVAIALVGPVSSNDHWAGVSRPWL